MGIDCLPREMPRGSIEVCAGYDRRLGHELDNLVGLIVVVMAILSFLGLH